MLLEVGINSMFDNFVQGVLFSAFKYFRNEYNMRELYGFVCKKLVSTADFFCCFKLQSLNQKTSVEVSCLSKKPLECFAHFILKWDSLL